MNCPACNADISDRADFCTQCGADVSAGFAQQANTAPSNVTCSETTYSQEVPQAYQGTGGYDSQAPQDYTQAQPQAEPPAPRGYMQPQGAPQGVQYTQHHVASVYPNIPQAQPAQPQVKNFAAKPLLGAGALKTKADTVCGIFGIALGILTLVIYGYFAVEIAMWVSRITAISSDAFGSMFTFSTLTKLGIPFIIHCGAIFMAVLAGVLFIGGGINALRVGRGKSALTASTVLLWFVLFAGVIAILVWADFDMGELSYGILGKPFDYFGIIAVQTSGPNPYLTYVPYIVMFAPSAVFAIVMGILLVFKKMRKRTIMQNRAVVAPLVMAAAGSAHASAMGAAVGAAQSGVANAPYSTNVTNVSLNGTSAPPTAPPAAQHSPYTYTSNQGDGR